MSNSTLKVYEVYMKDQAEAQSYDIMIPLGLLTICISPLVFVIVYMSIRNHIKSKRIGPITTIPIIPFSTDHLRRKQHPTSAIRLFCGSVAGGKGLNSIRLTTRLMKTLKMNIPRDVAVISIKMDGFNYGSDCQKFEPMDGMGPESYYTYQMFGDNRIQVTNYVDNKVSYVAGFVIYIPDGFSHFSNFSYQFGLIERFMESPKYKCTRPIIQKREAERIRMVRETTTLLDDFETEDWNVKRCGKLGRDVMTTVSDGSVYHKEWNMILKKMKADKCDVCTQNVDHDLLPPSYSSLSMA